MEIILTRKIFTDISTIGELSIDGKFECYTLEDMDRGLADASPIIYTDIQINKVHGQTCIPYGRYQVIITMSNRFKKQLPLLLNVKGFEGIRIHSGNVSADTDGCILVGKTMGLNTVLNSRDAFEHLFNKIQDALTTAGGEPVFITINRGI